VSIEKTITDYRNTKEAMQAIINRHMQAAFDEIKAEFGDTPTGLYVDIREYQTPSMRYPIGVYQRCEVKLGGD